MSSFYELWMFPWVLRVPPAGLLHYGFQGADEHSNPPAAISCWAQVSSSVPSTQTFSLEFTLSELSTAPDWFSVCRVYSIAHDPMWHLQLSFIPSNSLAFLSRPPDFLWVRHWLTTTAKDTLKSYLKEASTYGPTGAFIAFPWLSQKVSSPKPPKYWLVWNGSGGKRNSRVTTCFWRNPALLMLHSALAPHFGIPIVSRCFSGKFQFSISIAYLFCAKHY